VWQLVDEEDDAALGPLDLLEHGLEPVLELAPELRARDERAEVEAEDLLLLERLGDVALRDAQGDALGDRGLADARLADEHGVVLRPSRQHLHGAPDLLVAADDRVELARARELGEVARVLGERLVLALCLGVGDALVAADLGQRLEQVVAADAGVLERARRLAVILGDECQEQVLARDVLVLELLRLPARVLEQRFEAAADVQVGRAAADLGLGVERRIDLRLHQRDVDADLAQQRGDDALLLREQRREEVLGRQLLMTTALGERLCLAQGFLRLGGELLGSHVQSDRNHRHSRDK